MTAEGQRQLGHSLRSIPSGVWVLGFVSLLMDVSSEMIHSLLPLFMVTVLGTSTIAVGGSKDSRNLWRCSSRYFRGH